MRAPIAATADEASDGDTIRGEGWMNRVRLSDKLLAMVMLATSLLCLARLYLALGGEGLASGGISHAPGEPVFFARLGGLPGGRRDLRVRRPVVHSGRPPCGDRQRRPYDQSCGTSTAAVRSSASPATRARSTPW